jgi:hypothetical protein
MHLAQRRLIRFLLCLLLIPLYGLGERTSIGEKTKGLQNMIEKIIKNGETDKRAEESRPIWQHPGKKIAPAPEISPKAGKIGRRPQIALDKQSRIW